jgi:hypothetical protein
MMKDRFGVVLLLHLVYKYLYNSAVYILHFFGPFMINLVSAVILITKETRQKSNLQTHRTYKELLREQCR